MKKILIIIGAVVVVFAMFMLSTFPEIVEASKGLPEEAPVSEMVEEVDQDTDWQSVWAPVRQFAYLMVLLGISLIIKANIGFFKKHLVPTTLFGGLLGFVIGQVLWPVFGWEPIFDTALLQNLVYHAMSVEVA